jgi:NEDD8-activating enzyme E1
MSGFRDIAIIDMDTIDLSNLNRQFLFHDRDIGRYKAEVAAEFMNTRFRHLGVSIEHKSCRIEDLDIAFYRQFFLILGGLDSISARRWLNSTVFNLIERDSSTGEIDPSTVKFLIDGGSEGFKGQARVIVPYMTACFECTMDTFPPVTTYPLCTIAETPRLPEHCIEYALTVEFPKTYAETKFSSDFPDHLDWVFEAAVARAAKHQIQGVTRGLTESVIKRIVPAVASTNALIAALMVNEAFKLSTVANPVMDNYFMYMGTSGVNAETISYERSPDCLVCGGDIQRPLFLPKTATLQGLLDILTDPARFKLERPSITAGGEPIYMHSPESLRKYYLANLQKRLFDLLDGESSVSLVITDVSLAGRHFVLTVVFQ